LHDGQNHPGYWWLAVRWDNLVPACGMCNTYKTDRFPLEGSRAISPQDGSDLESLQDLEKPLVLHPLVDEPEDHLDFDDAARSSHDRAVSS
jgi:hypothetical protein